MIHPSTFPIIKFAIRQSTAFVGHSFASEDDEIVSKLIEFFSKLGLSCDTGRRAEASSVSDKVKKRLKNSEIFIGIFTRRGDPNNDGSYATSPWTIEEKATALAENKKVLIFVEEGVENIGGIQGDLEYIKFNRDNFGDALISAVDYILSVVKVPLETKIEGNNISITIGDSSTVEDKVIQLKKEKERHPRDVGIRLSLAKLWEQAGDHTAALKELEHARTDFPNNAEIHHQIGHSWKNIGNIDKAIKYFEQSIELNSAVAKYYFCFSLALYEKSKNFEKAARKRSVLEKSKRYLEQGIQIADPRSQQGMRRQLFLISEAIDALKPANRAVD